MDRVKGNLKYIVVNKKFLKQLSVVDQELFSNLLNKMDTHKNQYVVCNVDEPYAGKVMDMIFAGEYLKDKPQGSPLSKYKVTVLLKSGTFTKFVKRYMSEEDAKAQLCMNQKIAEIVDLKKL